MRIVLRVVFLLVFLFCKVHLHAQRVCTGSSGLPAFTENFGRGSSLNGRPISNKTNYDYYAPNIIRNFPQDGEYSIVNNTLSTNPGWYKIPTDHTGNGNGYMMLINADTIPRKIFFQDTIRNLCPGTNYVFTSWVLNILNFNGIDPNITFIIQSTSGQVLSTIETGNIPEGNDDDWRQYGVAFKTGENSQDVVLIMRNNSPGGIGNDLILDDIAFTPCGPTISLGIETLGQDSLTICPGLDRTLSLTASVSYDDPRYRWEVRKNAGDWDTIPNSNSSTYNYPITAPVQNDTYDFRVTVATVQNFERVDCRLMSDLVSVKVHEIIPNLKAPETVCFGETLLLSAESGGARYRWKGPGLDTTTLGINRLAVPGIDFSHAGKYYVEITSPSQCTTIDDVTVSVLPRPELVLEHPEVQICEGESVLIKASGGISYQWLPSAGLTDPGIATPNANPVVTTRYTVVIRNIDGCSDTGTVTVNVVNKLVPNAGPDRSMVAGNPIKLNTSVKGDNYTVRWLPETGLSDPTTLTPLVNATENTTYYMYVTSKERDCYIPPDTVNIRVLPGLIIPNAFTPNGDGINDDWQIIPLDTYPEALLTVFNRNGKIVYRSMGYTKAWNGRFDEQELPAGIYYYTIDLKISTEPLSGNVLIAR